jgi:ferritin-like metal-binding protein YciE
VCRAQSAVDPKGVSGMSLDTIEDVFVEQLADLYSAERQLVAALPKVQQAATDDGLREALANHLQETRSHVERLETIFGQLSRPVPMETCEGMKGLLAEGEKIIGMPGENSAKDAALIGAAQRVEHYEIAAYGTARALADELNLGEARDLLDRTLDEEGRADKMLSQLAMGGLFSSGINDKARS